MILERLLDIIYPPRCAACSLPGEWLCADCLSLCRRHTGQECSGELDALYAAYEYAGPAREIVHKFKFEGQHSAAPWMARHMTYSPLPPEGVLVPVPLHAKRLRERGYNQSALLARSLSRYSGLATTDALARLRYTQPQSSQKAADRHRNVQGAFAVRRSSFAGKSVVLVDDVYTTGATLDECSRVLRRAGASGVIGLVFARA